MVDRSGEDSVIIPKREFDEDKAKIATLEAENKRMREALEKIQKLYDEAYKGKGLIHAYDIAQAALGESDEDMV